MSEPESVCAARRALGRQLAAYRRAAGMSQHTVAPFVKYSRSTVANVEIGRQNAPRDFWECADQALAANGGLVDSFDELQVLIKTEGCRDARRLAADRAVAKLPQWAEGASLPGPLPVSFSTPQDGVFLRDVLLGGLSGDGQRHLSGELSAAIDGMRIVLDRSLAKCSVTSDQLDRMEEAVSNHAVNCVRLPPIDMLCRLALDIAEAGSVLAEAQPPKAVHRLYRVVAGLAVLMADELMVLGDIYAANAWYGTARTAAEQTRDRALQGTVMTLAARLPLYWGSPLQALELASQARFAAGGKASMATTMAPSIEALALAQSGDLNAGEKALGVARNAFEGGANQQVESVFGFSERRFFFYQGRTLTRLRKHKLATCVYEQALTLYPHDVPGDPTLIRLDQASGLVRRGDILQGIGLAQESLMVLPVEHRANIFVQAGYSVLKNVPHIQRKIATVREYDEFLRSL